MEKQREQHYTGRTKLRSTRIKRTLACISIILMMIPLVITTVINAFEVYHRYNPKVVEGQLVRKISEVIQYLPNAPENFEEQEFQPQIPKIVSDDIQRMTNSEEIKKVVYESKDGNSKLILEIIGNELIVTCEDQDQYFAFAEKIFGDIAIYKKDDGIQVYGQYMPNERTLAYFEVTEDYAFDSVWYESIDLLGVDKEIHSSFECGSSVTMARNGREFSFYRHGKQVGASTIFPGAEIQEIRDGYILDSKNDLYYAYYCSNIDEPWVKFVKVADNVGGISDTSVLVKRFHDDIATWLLPYEKDERLYLAVPDLDTRETFGIFSSGSHEQRLYRPNFEYDTVEISDENVREIIIYSAYSGASWQAQKMYYENTNYMVYTEERINGIDTYVSDKIPEEMLKKFEYLSVTPEYYQQVVTELKDLYENYY